ncbi:hypothetical protein [Streptacidiphilus sp. EB129]|uniref:hypothetical protein n=1 Tax=Streptacidiphilus sp. EB129 TaxID=3156262 RepID=UPI003516E367
MRRTAGRDETASVLRERLRAADEQIALPPGLWERIQTSSAQDARPARVREPLPRRRPFGGAVGAAALVFTVCAIAAGGWWLERPASRPDMAAGGPPVPTLTVYNAQAPCRPLRTMECALGLALDPYAPYSGANAAGKVWHGDLVQAQCVVTDGTLVEDESGITSTRWYLVSTSGGTRGWLPGVRTRNTIDIRTCTPAEASVR